MGARAAAGARGRARKHAGASGQGKRRGLVRRPRVEPRLEPRLGEARARHRSSQVSPGRAARCGRSRAAEAPSAAPAGRQASHPAGLAPGAARRLLSAAVPSLAGPQLAAWGPAWLRGEVTERAGARPSAHPRASTSWAWWHDAHSGPCLRGVATARRLREPFKNSPKVAVCDIMAVTSFFQRQGGLPRCSNLSGTRPN